MIKLERPETPESLNLDIAESPASIERQGMLDHLLLTGSLSKELKFKAYAGDDVKELLKRAFHGKCAYCEITAVAGFDGDIEHYRPKKGVTDADKADVEHPGYWWLGMVWANLLLSCQHCNQSRRQLIHQPGQSEEAIKLELTKNKLRTTGKKNRFPVEGNAWVTEHSGDIDSERPLLLNPFDTDPEALLEWEFERSISTVMARDGDQRAEQTIEILGLNRRWLTEARVTALNGLRQKRAKILKRIKLIDEAEDDVASVLLETVVEEMLEIQAACEPRNTFAGMTRAFYRKLNAEIAPMLA